MERGSTDICSRRRCDKDGLRYYDPRRSRDTIKRTSTLNQKEDVGVAEGTGEAWEPPSPLLLAKESGADEDLHLKLLPVLCPDKHERNGCGVLTLELHMR